MEWTGISGITDPGIALCGALSLFVIPVDWKGRRFAMDWETAKRCALGHPDPVRRRAQPGRGHRAPTAWTPSSAPASPASRGLPPWVLVLAVTAVVVFLTEITSNTAVATTLMPVLAATAVATGAPPGMLLTAAAIAASCAFMLPVATPPNAIVFASGYVTVPEMAKAGLGLNLIAILVVTVAVTLGSRLVLA